MKAAGAQGGVGGRGEGRGEGRVPGCVYMRGVDSTGNGAGGAARPGRANFSLSANMAVVTQVTKAANDIAAFELAQQILGGRVFESHYTQRLTANRLSLLLADKTFPGWI